MSDPVPIAEGRDLIKSGRYDAAVDRHRAVRGGRLRCARARSPREAAASFLHELPGDRRELLGCPRSPVARGSSRPDPRYHHALGKRREDWRDLLGSETETEEQRAPHHAREEDAGEDGRHVPAQEEAPGDAAGDCLVEIARCAPVHDSPHHAAARTSGSGYSYTMTLRFTSPCFMRSKAWFSSERGRRRLTSSLSWYLPSMKRSRSSGTSVRW